MLYRRWLTLARTLLTMCSGREHGIGIGSGTSPQPTLTVASSERGCVSLGFYTACVSHVGRGQSALLAHASTKVLPHLAGTATQAHTWWFADTTKLAELAELAEPAELASRTGRTE